MTTLLLDLMWVHDAADLSQAVAVPILPESEKYDAYVKVSARANGRRVATTSPGRSRAVNVRLARLDRSDYLALVDLLGQGRLCLFRMPRGRKLWGVVASIAAEERLMRDQLSSVSFVVDEVTHDEAV